MKVQREYPLSFLGKGQEAASVSPGEHTTNLAILPRYAIHTFCLLGQFLPFQLPYLAPSSGGHARILLTHSFAPGKGDEAVAGTYHPAGS